MGLPVWVPKQVALAKISVIAQPSIDIWQKIYIIKA